MAFKEEDFLQLSGIQHFLFCRRQWALIHIEQQWAENVKTVEGELMHKKVHSEDYQERRKNVLKVSALRVQSYTLGVSGECDLVEFHSDDNGVPLKETEGLWIPYPIEYKRGRAKSDHSDIAQLCAQAICLEEMFCCDVKKGALYYGETRRRQEIEFSEEIRSLVRNALKEMHELYKRGYTPKVKPKKGCKSCSLQEICLPDLLKNRSVEKYLREELQEKPCDIY